MLVFPTLVFWIETEVTVTRAGDWLTEAALTVVLAVAALSPENGSLVAVVALAVFESVVPLSVYRLATVVSGKKPSSKPIALTQATYNAQAHTVALTTRKPLKLTRKMPLQLTIVAKSVLDTLSRSLDGDHDGQPGGDYTATLTKAGAVAIKAARRAGP